MSSFSLNTIIKQLIDNQSALYITNKTFYNILCDMGCFDDCRKCRYVFKTFVEDGYAYKVIGYLQGELSKEDSLTDICNELTTKYKYSTCDISFCLQNIMYGLGALDNVEAYSVTLNYDWMENLQDIKSVLVEPEDGQDTEFVVLNNVPFDAKIYVDGKNIPNDDESIVLDLAYGQHLLKIQSPMYHSYENIIIVDRENPAPIDIVLKPKFGSLLVMSDSPEPIELYLDNINVGMLPYSVGKIASGKHTLKLTSPLYRNHVETFTISDGERLNKVIALKENYGDVVLDTDDKFMTVFIDGQYKGKGKWQGKLSLGKHQIQCLKDSHNSSTFDIHVVLGTNNITLPTLKGVYGCLVVKAKPVGAKVYLDEKLLGVSPLKYRNALVGKHQLLITHPDCNSFMKEICISENTETIEQPSLTKNYFSNYDELRIGDYLYSDGKFSHYLTERDPIGVVYSLETSFGEQVQGWTHGRILSYHSIPENIKYSLSRLPQIAKDLAQEEPNNTHSNWRITSLDDWEEVFRNILGISLANLITDDFKMDIRRNLNIDIDSSPSIAIYHKSPGRISFSADERRFVINENTRYTTSWQAKIRCIAAF